MSTHLDIYEIVGRELPVPGADHAATRNAIRRAIEGAGVVVEGESLPAEALSQADEAWFIAWGVTIEDGYSFYVVPASEVDAETAAILRKADGVTIEDGIGGTAELDPQGFAAWQTVALLLGLTTDIDFEPGELAARADAFGPFYLRKPHSGNVDASALDRRFVGVVHGYQFL